MARADRPRVADFEVVRLRREVHQQRLKRQRIWKQKVRRLRMEHVVEEVDLERVARVVDAAERQIRSRLDVERPDA